MLLRRVAQLEHRLDNVHGIPAGRGERGRFRRCDSASVHGTSRHRFPRAESSLRSMQGQHAMHQCTGRGSSGGGTRQQLCSVQSRKRAHRPRSVSAPNSRPSAPSSTAFATSVASAGGKSPSEVLSAGHTTGQVCSSYAPPSLPFCPPELFAMQVRAWLTCPGGARCGDHLQVRGRIQIGINVFTGTQAHTACPCPLSNACWLARFQITNKQNRARRSL